MGPVLPERGFLCPYSLDFSKIRLADFASERGGRHPHFVDHDGGQPERRAHLFNEGMRPLELCCVLPFDLRDGAGGFVLDSADGRIDLRWEDAAIDQTEAELTRCQ